MKDIAERKAKKKFKAAEKRVRRTHYRWLVVLSVFAWCYYAFVEPETVGYDIRYSIYVFWLPTIAGVIVIAFVRRKFLVYDFTNSKGVVLITFLACFYTLQGFLFSYLSVGQVAKISWDIANYREAKSNPHEARACAVTGYGSGGIHAHPWISFKWNDQHEEIPVSRSKIKDFNGRDPKEFSIEVQVQKGLWNYYLVNRTVIKEKQ